MNERIEAIRNLFDKEPGVFRELTSKEIIIAWGIIDQDGKTLDIQKLTDEQVEAAYDELQTWGKPANEDESI